LPIDRIVLETDAPYLAPVPFRGKRNNSTYIQYVADEIATIKGLSVDEVYERTWENAEKLYRINRA
ncbi:MAG: TatD family hydrolase, partial [Wujia sp.]